MIAGSVALVGFGLDSLIEVASGITLLWRLHNDADPGQREKADRLALRIVGSCFLLLSAYVAFNSIDSLVTVKAPGRSVTGIIVAADVDRNP